MRKHTNMKKKKPDLRAQIVDLLINKAALKQDVADYSEKVFDSFKELVQIELSVLRESVNDQRVRLRFEDKGKFEFRVFIGSDALVFQLHTNIFRPTDDDPIWKTKYLKDNNANGFFAVIRVYNFLAESFEQYRINDGGYLIGRIFMNHDCRFKVEGMGELSILFKGLEKNTVSDEIITEIIQYCMTYAIEFDLIIPPIDLVQEVSLSQINDIGSILHLTTVKKLGFKFGTDDKNSF